MIQYKNDILKNILKKAFSTMTTPATDYLFEVRKSTESKPLEEQAIVFLNGVVKLLFLSTRVRLDIKTPVAFLTSIKEPDSNDLGKLKRFPRCIN